MPLSLTEFTEATDSENRIVLKGSYLTRVACGDTGVLSLTERTEISEKSFELYLEDRLKARKTGVAMASHCDKRATLLRKK